MKNIGFTLEAGLLVQATGSYGFLFGKTDFSDITGQNFRYQYDCVQVITTFWGNLDRASRNNVFALCLLQRNSITNLLMTGTMQKIQQYQVSPRGGIADQLRVVEVDGYFADTQNQAKDTDGLAEARVQDILIKGGEICQYLGATITPVVEGIRRCSPGTADQFQACVCVSDMQKRDIHEFQSCIRGDDGNGIYQYAFANHKPPEFSCRARAPMKPVRKSRKLPSTNNSNKRDTTKNTVHEVDDGNNDDDQLCYLIYEDADLVGTTGPAAYCNYEPNLAYFSDKKYDDYALVNTYTYTTPPVITTATPVTTKISLASAFVAPPATNAVQSSAQAALVATASGTGSSPGDPTATSSQNSAAAGSLRSGHGGSLKIVTGALCLVLGAYLY